MKVRYTSDLPSGKFEETTLDEAMQIVELMVQLDRSKFICIEVTDADGRVLEGTGNDADGFSIIHREGKQEYITKMGPTFAEMAVVFEAFAKSDPEWFDLVEFVKL